MIKVEVDGFKNKIECHVEGTIAVVVSELMVIIENVVNTLGEAGCDAKEIVKGFLIESIGDL